MMESFFTKSETVARRYFMEKILLKISKNLLKNNCSLVSFLIKLRAFFNKA